MKRKSDDDIVNAIHTYSVHTSTEYYSNGRTEDNYSFVMCKDKEALNIIREMTNNMAQSSKDFLTFEIENLCSYLFFKHCKVRYFFI